MNAMKIENTKILHGCEVRIEISIPGILFGITRLCRVMQNSDPEGWNFLSALNTRLILFLAHLFDFECFILKVAFITTHNDVDVGHFLIWRHCDVAMLSTNDKVAWRPIQPMQTKFKWIFSFLGEITEIIRIFHECEERTENYIRGSLFGIARLCWVVSNSDPEGQIFLPAPNSHDRFFFLRTLGSPFDFNVEVAINDLQPMH